MDRRPSAAEQRIEIMRVLGMTVFGRALIAAVDVVAQRVALGLGSLATVTPTGSPDGSKFLRDDFSWQASGGGAHAASHAVGGSDPVSDVAYARGLRTTTGPTVLEMAGVADGQLLKRNGTTIVGASASGASFSSASIPFTDGDTVRRVAVVDATVIPSSKIIGMIRRPDMDDDKLDSGHLYVANVVFVSTAFFEIMVACCTRGFMDATESPPNETIEFLYQVA